MGAIENPYNLSPEDLIKEAELLEQRVGAKKIFGIYSKEYVKFRDALYRLRHGEKCRDLNRKYRQNNRDVSVQKSREYYEKNKDKQNERRRTDYVIHKARDIKRTVDWIKKRRKIDPFFKFKMDLKSLVRGAFYRRGYQKKSKTYNILGEEFEFVFMYLIHTAEKRYGFYDETKNYHIDHIVPMASAKSEDEALRLNHWTNLQYLTPEDNLAKSSKLDWEGGSL